MQFSTIPLLTLLVADVISAGGLSCAQDGCLREMNDPRFSSMASTFCPTYTTTANSDPSAIPSYLENCQGSPSAVSSACSCLIPTPTPACVQNGCLREQQDPRFSSMASTFCATYTQTINTNPSAIPTYLENCQNDPSQVSAACSCMPSPTPVCQADGCLREMQDPRFSSMASTFCPTYTAQINNNPLAVPTYLENCNNSPAGVSSACTCLFSTATPTVTTKVVRPTILPAAIVNYTQSCSNFSFAFVQSKPLLGATCLDAQSNPKYQTLDLNSCVGNNNGVLQFQFNFSGSCKNCTVFANQTLSCLSCKDRQQHDVAMPSLDLTTGIGNNNGTLQCVSPTFKKGKA